LDSNIEKQTNLEIDLLKAKSKLDETFLEINELKKNNITQKNLIDLLKKNYGDKEAQFNELHELYFRILNENKNFMNLSSNEKHKLQVKYTDLQSKVCLTWGLLLKDYIEFLWSVVDGSFVKID
jgi:hypothetical protein